MAGNSDMTALAVDEWDSHLAGIVNDMKGTPLNIHGLLANHPPLLAAWWQFRNYVVGGGSLGQRNAEIVILRTAVHSGSWYEWASHVVRGADAGLTDEQIAAAAGGTAQSIGDRLLIEAVDDLENTGGVRADTTAQFVQHFSQPALLDLIAIRATYIMLAGVLNTWNVPLDKHVADALPPGTTEAAFADAIGKRD